MPETSALHQPPDWVEHVLWWHVYPLGFTGAPTAEDQSQEEQSQEERAGGDQPHHRLRDLIGWLDHAVDLGLSGLALGPVFASSTHGYDTVDHFRIDPRLGDEADLDELVQQCHRRGLRVLLDGVFNHVGTAFPRFARILAEGREAPDQDWFILHWPADPDAPPDYDRFEGHAALVELNHSSPQVVDHVTSVMRYWLDRGVDGWRLDAAYAVPPEFWAEVLGRVRASHPDAYVVGEVIHGDYPDLVSRTGMDAVTQYELWKGIRSSLADRNLWELAHAVERHNGFLDTFVPLTFLGNHDVTRIASAVPRAEHRPHALAVLLLLGGTPTIYYGDELGLQAVKEDRVGGDDAVRPAFPPAGRLPEGADPAVVALHQELIGLRRRHPWLHRARTTVAELSNTASVLESTHDGHRLQLALNLEDGAVELAVPGAEAVLAGAGELSGAGGQGARVTLPPHGWAVLGQPG